MEAGPTDNAPAFAEEFGRSLVAFTLERQGWSVVRIENAGADLLVERSCERRAVSVRTCHRARGSACVPAARIRLAEVERLARFAARFGLIPWWAQVLCLDDLRETHAFLFPVELTSTLFPQLGEDFSFGFSADQLAIRGADDRLDHLVLRQVGAVERSRP